MSSSAPRRAAAVAPKRGGRFPLFLATGAVLSALLLAAMLLRLYRLSELPAGIDAGEGANGVDAIGVLQGEHAVFFPEKELGREPMVVYAMASAISLLGRNELALRLPTAVASAGAVLVVFWLGTVLFGRDEAGRPTAPWQGLLVGGAGAGLMAVSLGQTIIARTAFRVTLLPLFLALCIVLMWQGWTLRNRLRLALAGVCAGLLPYTYIPARFTPILFLLFGLSLVLTIRSGEHGLGRAAPSVDTARVRAELPWIGLFAGVALLVATPILLHFTLNPDHFFSRAGRLSIFHPALSQGDPLGALLKNVWHHLLAFGFRGDPFWRHNFAGQPMLNPWEGFFFWLGVGTAVWRWRQLPACRLLLIWLSVMLLPAFLSADPDGLVPNTLRMIGAAPAVYLLIGVGLWEGYRFLSERVPVLPRRAIPVCLSGGTAPAAATGAVVACLILTQGIAAFRTYFGEWAAAPQTFTAYDQEWTELARTLNAQPAAAATVYLVPYSKPEEPYGFHYLYQGPLPVHIFPEATARNLALMIQSKLEDSGSLTTAKVVEWKQDAAGGYTNQDERIVAILAKYARFQGSEDGDRYRIHTFADIDLDRPWTLYENLEPPKVEYDGGISLLGLALGQGAATLSSSQMFDMQNDQPLWMVFQWQTAPGLDLVYSISVRLHDAEGSIVRQKDAVLTDGNLSSTNHWKPGEPVETIHLFDFPPNLQPGEYELRLVVYDFESLKPTVELGVWQAETVLAGLRIEGFE